MKKNSYEYNRVRSNYYIFDKQPARVARNVIRLASSCIFKDEAAGIAAETAESARAFSMLKYCVEDGYDVDGQRIYATYNESVSKDIWLAGISHLFEPDEYNPTNFAFIEKNPYYKDLYDKYNVNVYIGRMARDQEILYYDPDYQDYLEDGELILFLECYEAALNYYNLVLRTPVFDSEPLFRPLMRCILVTGAIQMYMTKKSLSATDVEVFDQYTINNFLYSYGLAELVNMPVFMTKNIYQKRIIQRFSDLIQYRGSKRIIDIVTEIFSYGTLEVKKYFLCNDKSKNLYFYLSEYDSTDFFANINNSVRTEYKNFVSDEPDSQYWYDTENYIKNAEFNKANSKFLSFEAKTDIYKSVKFLSELMSYAVFEDESVYEMPGPVSDFDRFKRDGAVLRYDMPSLLAPAKGSDANESDEEDKYLVRTRILTSYPEEAKDSARTDCKYVYELETMDPSVLSDTDAAGEMNFEAMGEVSFSDYFNALKGLYMMSNGVLEYTEGVVETDNGQYTFENSTEGMRKLKEMVEANKKISKAILIDKNFSAKTGGYLRLVEGGYILGNGFLADDINGSTVYSPALSIGDKDGIPFPVRFNMVEVEENGNKVTVDADTVNMFNKLLPEYYPKTTYTENACRAHAVNYHKFADGTIDTQLVCNPMKERVYISNIEDMLTSGALERTSDASGNMSVDYTGYNDQNTLDYIKVALRAAVCFDSKDGFETTAILPPNVSGHAMGKIRSERFISHGNGKYITKKAAIEKAAESGYTGPAARKTKAARAEGYEFPDNKVKWEYLDTSLLNAYRNLDTSSWTEFRDKSGFLLTPDGILVDSKTCTLYSSTSDGVYTETTNTQNMLDIFIRINDIVEAPEGSLYKYETKQRYVRVQSRENVDTACKLIVRAETGEFPEFLELDDGKVYPVSELYGGNAGYRVENEFSVYGFLPPSAYSVGDAFVAVPYIAIEDFAAWCLGRGFITDTDEQSVNEFLSGVRRYMKVAYTNADVIRHIYKHWGFSAIDKGEQEMSSSADPLYGRDQINKFIPKITRSEIRSMLLGDIEDGVYKWNIDGLGQSLVNREYASLIEYCSRMGFKIIRNCKYKLEEISEASPSGIARTEAKRMIDELFVSDMKTLSLSSAPVTISDNKDLKYLPEVRVARTDDSGNIVNTDPVPPDIIPSEIQTWEKQHINDMIGSENVQTLSGLMKTDSLSKTFDRIHNAGFKKFVLQNLSYRFSSDNTSSSEMYDTLINERFVEGTNNSAVNTKMTYLLLLMYNNYINEESFQVLLAPSVSDTDTQMQFLREILDAFRAYTVKYKSFITIPVIEDNSADNLCCSGDRITKIRANYMVDDTVEAYEPAGVSEQVYPMYPVYNIPYNKSSTISYRPLYKLTENGQFLYKKTRYASLGRNDKLYVNRVSPENN